MLLLLDVISLCMRLIITRALSQFSSGNRSLIIKNLTLAIRSIVSAETNLDMI